MLDICKVVLLRCRRLLALRSNFSAHSLVLLKILVCRAIFALRIIYSAIMRSHSCAISEHNLFTRLSATHVADIVPNNRLGRIEELLSRSLSLFLSVIKYLLECWWLWLEEVFGWADHLSMPFS